MFEIVGEAGHPTVADPCGLGAGAKFAVHSVVVCRNEIAKRMIEAGQVSKGMIPKAEAVLYALRHGVEAAHIIDGRVAHAVLLEILTDAGVGTKVLPAALSGRAGGSA